MQVWEFALTSIFAMVPQVTASLQAASTCGFFHLNLHQSVFTIQEARSMAVTRMDFRSSTENVTLKGKRER
jgi:hypothetical protein